MRKPLTPFGSGISVEFSRTFRIEWNTAFVMVNAKDVYRHTDWPISLSVKTGWSSTLGCCKPLTQQKQINASWGM